jgi:ATP-dependent DNA helicase RecG
MAIPSMEQIAHKLGYKRPDDLLLHLPLRYEDETRLTRIRDLRPGQPALVEGLVSRAEVLYRPRRQLLVTLAEPDTAETFHFRMLNFYPSQQAQLKPGARLRLYGEVRPGFFGAEMVHPRWRAVAEGAPLPDTLTPIYPTVAGLSQARIQKAVAAVLAQVDLAETLPAALLDRLGLQGFEAAVRRLHGPQPEDSPASLERHEHPAWRRIKFDELLSQQLSLRLHAGQRRRQRAPVLAGDGLAERLRAALPFPLTAAQARTLAEIQADLGQAHPMHRLLQGDVGSGKTCVAALAALVAVGAGWQGAVMAPTEILAEQLYLKFREWLEPLGVRVVWLAAALKGKTKREAMAEIADGRAAVAVGTHALFQDEVAFKSLGLAIVDEQHRFGVEQRLALRGKGTLPSPTGGGAGGEGATHHYLPLPKETLDFARKLRTEQTDAEGLIWHLIRDRRLAGAKFQRQKPIGPYFLNFYCHERKLAIELDGGQHAEHVKQDALRDRFLAEQGIKVLRFWNNQVLGETEAVLESIWREITVAPSPLAPPPGGEGNTPPYSSPLTPHLLMMSATPIPRSLAMSYFADLDVSVIDELPPGRKPIATKVASSSKRAEVVARLRDYCGQGAQAYWVCPLVEESEKVDLKAAIDAHAELVAELPNLRIGLAHGRLKADQKAAVMAAFKAGELDLLVATTVIEVGVDVPNASLMVIEHAERMGLAQLHQLRGRVGRGGRESTCLLLYADPLSETARRRLRIIKDSQDGFVIAREDLALRGPGEFLGARQSGAPMLRFADLEADQDLLEQARDAAGQLLRHDPEAVRRHLARWLPHDQNWLQA